MISTSWPTFRDEAIFKYQFTSVASSHAELVEFLASGKSFGVALHDESTDALGRWPRRTSFGVDYKGRSNRSIGNPVSTMSADSGVRNNTRQNLLPLSLNPPFTFSAFNDMLTTSLPLPVSLIARAPIFSPLMRSGRYFNCSCLSDSEEYKLYDPTYLLFFRAPTIDLVYT